MSDPRDDIPDVILDAPDSSQWLSRSRSIYIAADRDGPINIVVQGQIIPVASVTDGRAQTLPIATAINGEFRVNLADVDPALAVGLAQFMAAQAATNGAALLSRIYPAEEPQS